MRWIVGKGFFNFDELNKYKYWKLETSGIPSTWQYLGTRRSLWGTGSWRQSRRKGKIDPSNCLPCCLASASSVPPWKRKKQTKHFSPINKKNHLPLSFSLSTIWIRDNAVKKNGLVLPTRKSDPAFHWPFNPSRKYLEVGISRVYIYTLYTRFEGRARSVRFSPVTRFEGKAAAVYPRVSRGTRNAMKPWDTRLSPPEAAISWRWRDEEKVLEEEEKEVGWGQCPLCRLSRVTKPAENCPSLAPVVADFLLSLLSYRTPRRSRRRRVSLLLRADFSNTFSSSVCIFH